MKKTQFYFTRIASIFFLLIITCAVSMAEPDAATLLTTGKQAMEASKWEEATSTLETLRKQFPQSPEVALGTVYLYKTYLSQKLADKASPLWDEVMTKWPRTEASYQTVLAYRAAYQEKEPEKVMQRLDEVLSKNLLGRAEIGHIKELRITLMSSKFPDRLITECLQTFKELRGTVSEANVTYLDLLSRSSYEIMMKAGRLDDARAIYQQSLEQSAFMGSPARMNSNSITYFEVLRRHSTERFLAEVLPLLKATKWAENDNEVIVSINYVGWTYPELAKNGRFSEIQPLHKMLTERIGKMTDSGDLAVKEYQAYFDALSQFDPDHFWPEAQPFLDKYKTPLTPEETPKLAALARTLYAPLLRSGRLEEAKTVHDQVQSALSKLNKPDEVKSDADAYRSSISLATLDALLSLYKKAAAADDKEGAKKWLTQLNLIAPESPQAIKARSIDKSLTAP